MSLSEKEIEQIRKLFDLRIEQLRENSMLRRSITRVEELDSTLNTALISTIQNNLTKITEYQGKVLELSNESASVKREKIDTEFETEYFSPNDGGDSIYTGYLYTINMLIQEIATILEIPQNRVSY